MCKDNSHGLRIHLYLSVNKGIIAVKRHTRSKGVVVKRGMRYRERTG